MRKVNLLLILFSMIDKNIQHMENSYLPKSKEFYFMSKTLKWENIEILIELFFIRFMIYLIILVNHWEKSHKFSLIGTPSMATHSSSFLDGQSILSNAFLRTRTSPCWACTSLCWRFPSHSHTFDWNESKPPSNFLISFLFIIIITYMSKASPTVECMLSMAFSCKSSPKVASCINKVEFKAALANSSDGRQSPE